VTLQELERRVAASRPTVDGEQVHTPRELGVAVFTHYTSRPTVEVAADPGRPPDPQLHSHAFVFNLAFCQGRYLAVDSRPIYQFATTAEAIYSAIDEPATSAPLLPHAFPHVSAAQHADGIEATRCGMRHREALLLADCWQSWILETAPCCRRDQAAPSRVHGHPRRRPHGGRQIIRSR
jgi:TrwC relaxase